MNGTTMGLGISSRYLCVFKMPSIKCTCVRCPSHKPAHTITPPPPWGIRSTTLASANLSHTRRHTCCLPSALYSENRDSSVKNSLRSLSSAHEKLRKKQKCCVYNFVQCISAAISLRLQGKLSFPYNCQKMNGQIYVLLC